MIKVEALIRPLMLNEVKLALLEIGVKSMTISEVKGWEWQEGQTLHYRGAGYTRDLVQRLRIEVVVRDVEAQLIGAIIADAARTGECGDGKIFFSPVTNALRVRTGDEGEDAIALRSGPKHHTK